MCTSDMCLLRDVANIPLECIEMKSQQIWDEIENVIPSSVKPSNYESVAEFLSPENFQLFLLHVSARILFCKYALCLPKIL